MDTRSEGERAGTDPSAEPQDQRPDGDGSSMLAQLQQMIDDVAHQARPVLREVAAKAAELAATAAERAGPIATRAAEATQTVGERVAARSKEVAADLRRSAAEEGTPTPPPADTPPEWRAPGEPTETAEAPGDEPPAGDPVEDRPSI